jgi:hypothetical protein
MTRPNTYQDFNKHYSLDKKSGCWLWTGYKLHPTKANPHGYRYGRININSKPMLAHRVAWIATYGEIPEGMCVCHKCDVPACVNPDHLFLGTRSDNIKDSVNKGRFCIGERAWKSVISENDVREIISSPKSTRALSKMYGIDAGQVSRIKQRKAWKHIIYKGEAI